MNFNTPESFLEGINKWFNGLIAPPLLAVAYGYLEIFSGGIEGMVIVSNYITATVIIILLIYAVYSTLGYKKLLTSISVDGSLKSKLTEFYITSKQFYIKIFVISMLSVVGLYITGSVAYAGFYAFLLFLLSIYRPSLLTVANKLGLKGEERTEFIKGSKTVIN